MRVSAQRLRLLLARALVKVENGLALTEKEEHLIAEVYRRRYERRREVVTVTADGTVNIKRTIDASPIMEAMLAYGSFVDRHTQSKLAQRMVGSIDPLTADRWMKECGFAVGTKGFANFAMKRIKSDIDYRGFRVGH
jgi:hypothetical protein